MRPFLLLVAVPGILAAQASPARRDTTRADSVSADSLHHPIHSVLPYVGLVVGGAAVIATLFAATPVMYFGPPGPSEMSFLHTGGAVSLSVGGVFQRGQTWAHAAHLEGMSGAFHYELFAEDFWRPVHVEYVTVRTGYLMRRRFTAGGLTIGLTNAGREARDTGAEIGLPVYFGDRRGVFARLEPTYIASRRGLLWNYRAELDIPVLQGPYYLGVSGVGKSDPPASPDNPNNFAHSAVLLVFGSSF